MATRWATPAGLRLLPSNARSIANQISSQIGTPIRTPRISMSAGKGRHETGVFRRTPHNSANDACGAPPFAHHRQRPRYCTTARHQSCAPKINAGPPSAVGATRSSTILRARQKRTLEHKIFRRIASQKQLTGNNNICPRSRSYGASASEARHCPTSHPQLDPTAPARF